MDSSVETVQVLFSVDMTARKTVFKENVYLIGSAPELGSWDYKLAPKLSTSNGSEWCGKIVFESVNLATEVTYKYVIRHEDQPDSVEYEGTGDADNRALDLTEAQKIIGGDAGGTVYIVPEALWLLSETRHPGYGAYCQYLEWNTIVKNIVVGTCPRSWDDMRRIRDDAHCTAVFNCQEFIDIEKHSSQIAFKDLRHEYAHLGVVYVHVPIKDFSDPEKARKLADAVFLMDGLIRSGHVVYCHCTAGIGRSIAITVAYLHWVRKMPLNKVFDHVRKARPKAYLNAQPINDSTWEFRKKYGGAVESMNRAGTVVNLEKSVE